jgi:glycosyltransferase involved in cell wall biosynthesis
MPAFNASKTIVSAVESVIAQTFSDWELLIINDGSSDDTLKQVANFDDQRIKVLSQLNKGVASARNAGLDVATGEFIAFLDSDDLWLPSKLEKQLKVFTSYGSEVGLVYTKYRGFTDNASDSHSLGFDGIELLSNDYYSLLVMDYIPTLTVMIRSNIVEHVGLFREDLRGVEDWDFWIRIKKSYELKKINEELALYRISPFSLSGNKISHAAEELKVLDAHVVNKINIPDSVVNMAFLFWHIKKIKYLLIGSQYKEAIKCFFDLLKLQKISLLNYLLLFKWITKNIFHRCTSAYK